MGPGLRFRVFALASLDTGLCSALVALLEGEEPLETPRPALLAEIGGLLDPCWGDPAEDTLDSASVEITREL